MNENRIALITGAGSGIGRAAALALHTAGFSVVVAGRRASEIEKTAAMAARSGGRDPRGPHRREPARFRERAFRAHSRRVRTARRAVQ